MTFTVPPALLVKDVGGIPLAQETRKICFLKQAPRFLEDLVAKIDASLRAQITIERGSKKDSGVVKLVTSSLILQVEEDAQKRDGIVLTTKIVRPDGSMARHQQMPIKTMKEDGALSYYIYLVQQELASIRILLN